MRKKQPAKPRPEAAAPRLQVVVSDEFIQAVDEWRGKQPGVPNRSKAIRLLVELALRK